MVSSSSCGGKLLRSVLHLLRNITLSELCALQGPGQCDSCRNARDGPYCVSECPVSKYRDENGICQDCHPNCAASAGCTGPRNSIGDGACRSCPLVVVSDDDPNNATQCLHADSQCDDGYYKHNFALVPGVMV